MLDIQCWELSRSNPQVTYAFNHGRELRLENSALSESVIAMEIAPSGFDGELSPGNHRIFDFKAPMGITIKLEDLSKEAVGSFVLAEQRVRTSNRDSGKENTWSFELHGKEEDGWETPEGCRTVEFHNHGPGVVNVYRRRKGENQDEKLATLGDGGTHRDDVRPGDWVAVKLVEDGQHNGASGETNFS